MTMNIIRYALAGLPLLVAVPAYAGPQMPVSMQGVWCNAEPSKEKSQVYFHRHCTNEELVTGYEIEVTANGLGKQKRLANPENDTVSCTAVKITKFNVPNPWGRKGWVNAWGPGYRIKFRCEEDNKTSTVTESWQLEKDRLITER
jgi:hypothetical protein